MFISFWPFLRYVSKEHSLTFKGHFTFQDILQATVSVCLSLSSNSLQQGNPRKHDSGMPFDCHRSSSSWKNHYYYSWISGRVFNLIKLFQPNSLYICNLVHIYLCFYIAIHSSSDMFIRFPCPMLFWYMRLIVISGKLNPYTRMRQFYECFLNCRPL